MKIYALRDRLIDYYLVPFAAQSTKEVLAGVATAINREGNLDAIAQTPHHFEIWQLGEVDEEGHIHKHKEFVTTCDALVRPRREPAGNEQRTPTGGETTGGGPYTLGGTISPPRAPESLKTDGAQTQTVPRGPKSQGVPGIPEGA